jgi:hypothetical protein
MKICALQSMSHYYQILKIIYRNEQFVEIDNSFYNTFLVRL